MADLSPWRRHIEAAIAEGHGEYTFEDIEREVEAGRMQIWTDPNGALITQVHMFPKRKEMLVYFGGGTLEVVEKLAEQACAWGKSIGCTHATAIGRLGWERTFAARTGWQMKRVLLMEKAL